MEEKCLVFMILQSFSKPGVLTVMLFFITFDQPAEIYFIFKIKVII